MDMVYRLPSIELVRSRNEFITSYCTGKRVLHLGCAESGNAAQSIDHGTLLHQRLLDVATAVTGVDLDGKSIALLRQQGMSNLVEGDVEQLDALALDGPFDVVVAGEILEHLSNPGRCLDGVSRLMERFGATLLLTVPNAFSVRHAIPMAAWRKEFVMPDHTAYFSPSTLTALLGRYHLQIERFYAHSNTEQIASRSKRALKRVLDATLFTLAPQLAEGLIAVARRAT
ncbi:class I SAM-dependent methyltransferase [Candidatus Uhrbacteria bacterium]|nr:class I SAM-dependent methyltransferase [Candidatus Uhrbacteria bacterium]